MRWLVAAVLVLALLSGCTSKNTGTTSGTNTGTLHYGAGSSTKASQPVANGTVMASTHAPTANLTASRLNGTAPLNVTFTLRAGDLDGGVLNWTLVFGDGNATHGSLTPVSANSTGSHALNGTAVNKTAPTYAALNITHGYTTKGLLNVTFLVTDGTSNATVALRLNVTGVLGYAPGHDPKCQRTKVTLSQQGYYYDDRGGSALGVAPNEAYGGALTSQGAWLYKETNGIPGLQISQNPGVTPVLGGPSDIDPLAVANHCVGGDELQF